MSCERSRGQPGTIEIGLVEPPEWNAPGSHDGFACEHSVAAVAVLIDVAAAHHAKLVAMSLPPWDYASSVRHPHRELRRAHGRRSAPDRFGGAIGLGPRRIGRMRGYSALI